MKQVELTCEVRCLDEAENQSYRLYIDDNLITERTWIWPYHFRIKEHVYIDIEPGEHTIRVEPVDKKFTKFYVNALHLDGYPTGKVSGVFKAL
jgi:hypothetical protein